MSPQVGNLPDSGPLPKEIREPRNSAYSDIKQLMSYLSNSVKWCFLRYIGTITLLEIATILDMPQTTAKTYFR